MNPCPSPPPNLLAASRTLASSQALCTASLVVAARGTRAMRTGSRRRGRLVRRHWDYGTSESCGSLLASVIANGADGMLRLAINAPRACDPSAWPGPRSIRGSMTEPNHTRLGMCWIAEAAGSEWRLLSPAGRPDSRGTAVGERTSGAGPWRRSRRGPSATFRAPRRLGSAHDFSAARRRSADERQRKCLVDKGRRARRSEVLSATACGREMFAS